MPQEQNTQSGLIKLNGDLALLFYYVRKPETVMAIRESRVFIPDAEDDRFPFQCPDMYTLSHINLTDARPEEGRESIESATGMDREKINYGIELLVDRKGLVQALPHLPRAYQIFSEQPVPVKVIAVRKMDKFERGRWTVDRFVSSAGVPFGFYAHHRTVAQPAYQLSK